MRRKLTLTAIGLALVAFGFGSGVIIQHTRSGFHYEVRDTEEYSSPVGPVRWSYVTESVGISLLDPGTTILEFDDRTIYKAKRGFQESSPYARNVIPTENGIAWEDGDYHFNLTITRNLP